MSFTFRVSLCVLALSLSLINPALAQSQSVPNPPASSEVNELAAALVGAASEEEQERLLARKKELMNSSLLAALKALANPFAQKGDYAEALRISELAVRIAERIGDRAQLGYAWCDLGLIYDRQNHAEQALDCFQKGLAIFEEAGNKKGKARDMFDEKLLDRMNFGDLNQSLDYVLERIGKIEDELSEGEDDPRLDMLYVLANKIVMRMDSIIRESGGSFPEALAQWNKVMAGYEERFEKYSDILLEEDTLLDIE